MPTSHLPLPYLLLFIPHRHRVLSPLLGILSHLFAPSLAGGSNFPPPGFDLLLTIWAACLAVLQITNLYIRRDFRKQKQIQTAAALVDVLLLALYVWTQMKKGKTDVNHWDGGDWLRVGVYAALALGRASFVAGEQDTVQAIEAKKES